MDTSMMQLIAGSMSSILFASGTMGMLSKAWRTKDMESYSISNLALNNVGNVVYWVYVASLPFGPVWIMHGFYTFAMILMLAWSLMYRHRPETTRRITEVVKSCIPTTREKPHFKAEN